MDDLKSLVKKSLYIGGFYGGLRVLDDARHPGSRLVILVYHNLSDGSERADGAVHPFRIRPLLTTDVFELHLRVLKQQYEVVGLDEGLARLQRDDRRARMVAITFDDGYRSFQDLAFPRLEAQGYTATVFLPTDFIGQNRFFWWDRLNQVVYALLEDLPDHAALAEVLDSDTATGLERSRSDPSRAISNLQALERSWIELPALERERHIDLLEGLLSKEARARLSPEPVLNWEQIRCLHQKGIRFGSHTCSHLTFGEASPELALQELKDSKKEIEGRLDAAVTGFAFPYGADLESYRLAAPLLRGTGYTYARTTAWAYNTTATDPYLLHRAHMDYTLSPALTRRDMQINFLRRPGR